MEHLQEAAFGKLPMAEWDAELELFLQPVLQCLPEKRLRSAEAGSARDSDWPVAAADPHGARGDSPGGEDLADNQEILPLCPAHQRPRPHHCRCPHLARLHGPLASPSVDGKLGLSSDLDGPYVRLAGISAVLAVATLTFTAQRPFSKTGGTFG